MPPILFHQAYIIVVGFGTPTNTFAISKNHPCSTFTVLVRCWISKLHVWFFCSKMYYVHFLGCECASVFLWTESSALCIFHNTNRIYFLFTYLINQLQKVCRTGVFLLIYKILIFGNFFFDFVLCPCKMNVKVHYPSEFLLQPLWIFHDDTSRWLTLHKYRVWPK